MGAKLLGVDVGFSTKRSTTAIAVLDGDQIHLARAGTDWESRVSQIPSGFRATVIAIDGPLLPLGADHLLIVYVWRFSFIPRFTTDARAIGGSGQH
jgi:predicted nuclease with RNAse H fold